jgi:hypothetical protein
MSHFSIELCWNCFESRWPYVVDYLHKQNSTPILIYIFFYPQEFSLCVQFTMVDNLDLVAKHFVARQDHWVSFKFPSTLNNAKLLMQSTLFCQITIVNFKLGSMSFRKYVFQD